MKIKKIKLLKALALTGAFGIVATVPVIVSACSSTSDNNGGSGENNQGGTDGNNQGGGGDSGGGSTETQKVTPKLKSSINLSGSLKNIYDPSSGKATKDLLAQEIKNNPSLAFDESDKLNGKNFDVSVDATFSRSSWTDKTYDTEKNQWEGVTIEEDNKLYYSHESEQLNISSLDDLKTQLSEQSKLKNILKDAGATVDDSATYNVKNQPGLTNDDLIHINVEKTGSAPVEYDLQIPTSDINLSIPNLSVTVSGTDVVETKGTVNLKYNIGINDKTTYTGPTEVKKIDSQATEDSVLTALGFKSTTPSSKRVARSTFSTSKQNTAATPAAEVAIDSEKLGETLGVFNTVFTNPKLTLDESNAPSETNNYFTYKLTVTGTPNSGYVWEDETTNEKEFSFLVKITEVTASYDTTNLSTKYSNQSFTWTGSGAPSSPNASNKATLNTKLQNHANGSSKDANIQKMLDDMTEKAKAEGIITNADMALLSDTSDGYIRFTSSSNKWEVRVIAKVNAGYEAKASSDFTKMKLWLTITFA